MSDDYPDGNSAWERINDSEYVNGKKVMKTNKLAGLDELAVEIMNITGGKYTDEQEQKMMAAISSEVAKAKKAAVKEAVEIIDLNDSVGGDWKAAILVYFELQEEYEEHLNKLVAKAEVESNG